MAAGTLAASLSSAGTTAAQPRSLPAKPRVSILSFRSYRQRQVAAMASSPPPRSPFPRRGRRGTLPATAAVYDAAVAAGLLTLKTRLAAGETLYGLFLLSASPTLAEISGLAGYDYVVVDMEHGPGGISEALPCLRALAATGTPAILRLPESSAVWAKKALDLGPQGIMFPMVDDAAAAAEAVSYCRYPPRGVRGAAHPVVRASGYGIDEGYLEHHEEELLVMCQVETERGVEAAEAIAAVDGVDCVQMGPLDLSANLGYLWEPGHRKVREVLREVERRVLSTSGGGGGEGAYLSGFSMPHDPPEELKRRGYHMVAGAVDLGMFRKAAVEDVLKFRNAPGSGGAAAAGGGDEDQKGYWSE